MFGRDNAGPARSRANAGPLPIPLPMRPWRIGTSVRVAKYMKAPTTDAKRFDCRELPPTARLTHAEGINPSWPGRPRSAPATSTPMNKRGRICLAKPQVERNHCPLSPLSVLAMMERPIAAAAKATIGSWGNRIARTAVGTAATSTFNPFKPNQRTRIIAKNPETKLVTIHLAE